MPYVIPPKKTGLPPGNYPRWKIDQWARLYPDWYKELLVRTKTMSKPHPANIKAQQRIYEKPPMVYFYGSGEKKTVKEVETPKTKSKTGGKTAKSKNIVVTPPKETKLSPGYYPSWQLMEWAIKYPEWYQANKSLFTKKEREEIEKTQRYNQQRSQLMEEIVESGNVERPSFGSGEDVEKMSDEERARAIRVLGLGGEILGSEEKDYHEYVYGKVEEGYVAPWIDREKFYEIRNQILEYYHKYKDVLTPQEKQNINRMLHSKILPINWRQYTLHSYRKKLEREKALERITSRLNIGSPPPKISIEELNQPLKRGKKSEKVSEIPGMEFLQLSYDASKRLATSGLKLEPTWEEEVESKAASLLALKKRLEKEGEALEKEGKSLEKERKRLEWESGLFKSTTNPEAMNALAKYRAGLISGDTVVYWWNGYRFEKITVAELNKRYENYLARVEQYNKRAEIFRVKKWVFETKSKKFNKEIEEYRGLVAEGPKPFERSFSGIISNILDNAERILDRVTGGLWSEYWKYTPAGMSASIGASIMLGKPTQVSYSPIELARFPVAIMGATESAITEGMPGLLSLTGLEVKPLTHLPDLTEAFIGRITGNRRGMKEYEYMFKHPGYLAGSLVGEYLVGEALAKVFGPPLGYAYRKAKPVISEIRPIFSEVGRGIRSTTVKVARKLFPYTYEEYRVGKGPFTHIFGEKSFPTFIKERYVKPTWEWFKDLFVKRETKYFKEEFGRVKSKGFTTQFPEGTSVIFESGEIKILKTPISKQEYLRLQSKLNKAIHGLAGDYVKFGGEVGRGEVLVKPGARWEATNLLNAIRRGRAGIGKTEYYLTTRTPALEDFLRRYIYPTGIETGERFAAGLERFMFIRKGDKILFSRVIETPNLLRPGKFTTEFIPKYAYRYARGGFFGKGISSGAKPSGGLFVKTMGKTVSKTFKLPPLLGLTSKIETKLKNIVSPLMFTRTIRKTGVKTIPRIEPLIGLKSEQILKPIEIPVMGIKTKTYFLDLQPLIGFKQPEIQLLPPLRGKDIQLLPPLRGVGTTPRTRPRIGIRPFEDIVPRIEELTGIKPIETTTPKTPEISTPIVPEEPFKPIEPIEPIEPKIPPIPPILFPGLGGGFSSRRHGGWWKGFNIKFPIAEPEDLVFGKKRKRRKRRKRNYSLI